MTGQKVKYKIERVWRNRGRGSVDKMFLGDKEEKILSRGLDGQLYNLTSKDKELQKYDQIYTKQRKTQVYKVYKEGRLGTVGALEHKVQAEIVKYKQMRLVRLYLTVLIIIINQIFNLRLIWCHLYLLSKEQGYQGFT